MTGTLARLRGLSGWAEHDFWSLDKTRKVSLYATATFSERWSAPRHRLAWGDRAHRHLEGARSGSADGPAAQHRWRWARRPGRTRRGAAGRLRLPDGVLSLLGASARSR